VPISAGHGRDAMQPELLEMIPTFTPKCSPALPFEATWPSQSDLAVVRAPTAVRSAMMEMWAQDLNVIAKRGQLLDQQGPCPHFRTTLDESAELQHDASEGEQNARSSWPCVAVFDLSSSALRQRMPWRTQLTASARLTPRGRHPKR
jgi:hypothetical protein